MTTMLESILKRDRWIVASTLVLINSLAWGWLLSTTGMGMDMMDQPAWTMGYIVLMFFLWWMMMIAMMLPIASPTILLAAALNRRPIASVPGFGSTGFFTTGYLLAWAGFSFIAVAAQWWMQDIGWLNNMLISQRHSVSGILLFVAGLWQFTPWKYACLQHCKSPVEFLTDERDRGQSSALQMGLKHGAFCPGYCWFLMALLFVGGVMGMLWIIGLTIYIWIEKIVPGGETISRLMGGLLALWGLGLLTGII